MRSCYLTIFSLVCMRTFGQNFSSHHPTSNSSLNEPETNLVIDGAGISSAKFAISTTSQGSSTPESSSWTMINATSPSFQEPYSEKSLYLEFGNLQPDIPLPLAPRAPSASQVDVLFAKHNGATSAGISMENLHESMETMLLMQQLNAMGRGGPGLTGNGVTGTGHAIGRLSGGFGQFTGINNPYFMSSLISNQGGQKAAPFHNMQGFGSPVMGMGGLAGMRHSLFGSGMPFGGAAGMGGLGALGADPPAGGAADHTCPKWARMFCGSGECAADAVWLPLIQCRLQMGLPMCRCAVGPALVKCCPGEGGGMPNVAV